ncbi:MAG: HD-GYP domain-containing protein [Bacillota bacterium]
MRKIPINLLQPGMRVGQVLYNSLGQLLVNKGTILTEKLIARLRMAGIPSIYVENDFLSNVEIVDVITSEVRVKAKRQVRELLHETSVSGCGCAIIKLTEITRTIEQIIDQLFANPGLMVNLVDVRAIDDYTFGHSVNVCVLSLITGITLGYDRAKLLALGIGALLHDIGKAKIPDKILTKPGKLTKEEFEIVREHPVFGYNMLLKMPGVSVDSAHIAHEHHERYQGQGYPRGLKQKEIKDFAVICGIADVFDALTSDRVYRKAYPIHEAYELLSASGNFLFSYQMVEAFLQNIAAYPLGTTVRLSSGQIGVVVETRRGMAVHPRVRVFLDSTGSGIEPFDIELWENRDIVVAEVLDEKELKAAIARDVESGFIE